MPMLLPRTDVTAVTGVARQRGVGQVADVTAILEERPQMRPTWGGRGPGEDGPRSCE
jgi:hypothetical protein